MSRNSLIQQIESLLKAPSIKTVFLLEGKCYVIDRDIIRESSLSEVTEALEAFPELPVNAFLLHPAWNKLTKRFEQDSFRDSLPDPIQGAKGLEVILCDSRGRAGKFMQMKRDNEYTGYYQTVELNPGISPSVSYT